MHSAGLTGSACDVDGMAPSPRSKNAEGGAVTPQGLRVAHGAFAGNMDDTYGEDQQQEQFGAHKRRRDDRMQQQQPSSGAVPAQQEQHEQQHADEGQQEGALVVRRVLQNKHQLTGLVGDGLGRMNEQLTQINENLDDMERTVVAFLERLKLEWRNQIQDVRQQVLVFHAQNTLELCKLSDDAQESSHRRAQLVHAVKALGCQVDTVQDSALVAGQFGTGC